MHLHTSERWQEYKPASYDKQMRKVCYMRYCVKCPGCGRIGIGPWNLVAISRKGK